MSEHLVINTLTGRVHCYGCGKTEPFNEKMPLPLDVVSALLKAYRRQHKSCSTGPFQTDEGRQLQEIDKKEAEAFFEIQETKHGRP